MPISVLGFYGAVALWAILIARGVFKPKQWPLIAGFGLVLLLFLNVRYLIEGAPAGIAFFISLYDFFDNLGLSAGEVPSAMAPAKETPARSGVTPISCIKPGESRSLNGLLMPQQCAPTPCTCTSPATRLYSF